MTNQIFLIVADLKVAKFNNAHKFPDILKKVLVDCDIFQDQV